MATKVLIRRDPPHSRESFLADDRHVAPDGWTVERNHLPHSIRFARICAGLDCTVTDFGSTVHWRVFCQLDSVPIMAFGWESDLQIAVAVVEDSAQRLRLKQAIPRLTPCGGLDV